MKRLKPRDIYKEQIYHINGKDYVHNEGLGPGFKVLKKDLGPYKEPKKLADGRIRDEGAIVCMSKFSLIFATWDSMQMEQDPSNLE